MACPSDETLQTFVDGTLPGGELSAFLAHLDGCSACRACVSAAAPSAVERVGRYRLLRPLGVGAMGVVYEAHDPELGRSVAVKLLKPDLSGSSLEARLISEAQALAKLSHPQVVSVHDVGRQGAQTYVVMDLVDGRSLRAWLHEETRSLEAVLSCFIQAAAGLEAAHQVGLVHRDFKPENVMVASDGRVRVTDFGLAIDGRGVRRVAIAEGSPAYMAPEQAAGIAADARSDQFSFFVTLQEAIQGKRVPAWLRQTITKGLAASPEQRFASMSHVRALLESAAPRRRRKLAAVSLGIVLGAVSVLVVVSLVRERQVERACQAESARVDESYNASVQAQLATAFRQTHSVLAERAWADAQTRLRRYVTEWTKASMRVCRRAQGDADAVLLNAERRCLERRRVSLNAVAGVLAKVDAEMLERVPAVIDTLGSIESCSNVRELAPETPPTAEQNSDETTGLAEEAKVSLAAGRYPQALQLANSAVTLATQRKQWWASAQALLWRGTAHGRLGHFADAESDLKEAASVASSLGAELVTIEAWIRLAQFIGFEAGRSEDGHRYDRYARSALERVPFGRALEAERLGWRCALLTREKNFPAALEAAQAQLAVVETHLGVGHPLRTVALDSLAGALAGVGRTKEAEQRQGEACQLLEQEVGPLHPRVAACLNNLGGLAASQRDWTTAIELRRRALDVLRAVPGSPTQRASIHRNLARALDAVGKSGEAELERQQAGLVVDGGVGQR